MKILNRERLAAELESYKRDAILYLQIVSSLTQSNHAFRHHIVEPPFEFNTWLPLKLVEVDRLGFLRPLKPIYDEMMKERLGFFSTYLTADLIPMLSFEMAEDAVMFKMKHVGPEHEYPPAL